MLVSGGLLFLAQSTKIYSNVFLRVKLLLLVLALLNVALFHSTTYRNHSRLGRSDPRRRHPARMFASTIAPAPLGRRDRLTDSSLISDRRTSDDRAGVHLAPAEHWAGRYLAGSDRGISPPPKPSTSSLVAGGWRGCWSPISLCWGGADALSGESLLTQLRGLFYVVGLFGRGGVGRAARGARDRTSTTRIHSFL